MIKNVIIGILLVVITVGTIVVVQADNNWKQLKTIDDQKFAVMQEKNDLAGEMLGAAASLNMMKLDDDKVKVENAQKKNTALDDQRIDQLKKLGLSWSIPN